MKRLLTALVLITVMAVSAMAATKTVTGKVTAVDGTKITIAIDGERADWVKKNAFVKFKVGPGKIVEVSAAGSRSGHDRGQHQEGVGVQGRRRRDVREGSRRIGLLTVIDVPDSC